VEDEDLKPLKNRLKLNWDGDEELRVFLLHIQSVDPAKVQELRDARNEQIAFELR